MSRFASDSSRPRERRPGWLAFGYRTSNWWRSPDSLAQRSPHSVPTSILGSAGSAWGPRPPRRNGNRDAVSRLPCTSPKEDHMARIRTFSIAATLGLALLTMASPATAYIVGALTSIRAEDAADDATLEKAIRAAVDAVSV